MRIHLHHIIFLKHSMFFLLLFILLPVCVHAAPHFTVLNKTKYRNIGPVAWTCRMRCIRNGKKLTYRGGGRVLQMELTGRRIVWNGLTVLLGYPVQQYRDGIYVAESDWNSTLRILFAPWTVPNHRLRRITIDAGHGGVDKGASGRFLREKNVTLKLSLRVAEILRRYGYFVRLTRAGDVTLGLKERPLLQKKHKSNLFVSIHVNATVNQKVSGIETFCLTPADAPSTNGKPELQSNPANIWDRNNFALACRIQNALLRRTKAADRGVKRARFAVLRSISAPGVLVEVGFISNPEEEKLLNDPVYLEKLSQGIADGILSYHRNLSRRKY